MRLKMVREKTAINFMGMRMPFIFGSLVAALASIVVFFYPWIELRHRFPGRDHDYG